MKKSITLTNEQKEELRSLLQVKNKHWRYYKRLETIYLADQGLSASIIAERLCVNKLRIYEYIKQFQNGSFSLLLKVDLPGKESLLTEEKIENLEQFIGQQKTIHKKCTPKDMANWLGENYNLAISPKWIYKRILMRRNAKLSEPWE